jgi:lysophospholipase L1-like esterase
VAWDWGFGGPGKYYDKNAGNCLRIWDAWAAQMQTDTTWTHGQHNLTFVGCSGNRYNDIADSENSQISQAGSPRFITLTIGGNDLGFFNVASNCIYQQDGTKDYGPQYKDDTQRTGECAKAIDQARNNINDLAYGQITAIFKKIVESPNINNGNKFDIYLTGYVHFFNVDTTDCNSWDFGAPVLPSQTQHHPLLSQELRTDMNDLVQRVNDAYSQAVHDYLYDPSIPTNVDVTFVNITPIFDGHRFCEAGHTRDDQYNSPDVWIWNLSTHLFSGKAAVDGVPDPTDPNYPTDQSDILSQQLAQSLSVGGLFDLDDATGTLSNPTGVQPFIGMKSRPFHPTHSGHAAIAQVLIDVIKGHI